MCISCNTKAQASVEDVPFASWGLHDWQLVSRPERAGWFTVVATEGRYLLKVLSNATRNLGHIAQGLAVQRYARHCGVPVARIVETHRGDVAVPIPGGMAILEVELTPTTDKMADADWVALGEVTVHLHNLAVPRAIEPSRLDPCIFYQTAVDTVCGYLTTIPHPLRSEVDRLLALIDGPDALAGHARVLIHTDLCWANVIRTAVGAISLIDFEGAGVAPAVMDLVEVTTQLCPGVAGAGPLDVHASTLFYRGYQAHRSLKGVDRDALRSAHALHQLYFLADALSREDVSFVERMQLRMQTWEDEVLDQLVTVLKAN